MNLFIANPSYQGGTQNVRAQLAAHSQRDGRTIHHFEIASSLLTWSFNTAWATALNLKEQAGLTHFLLWHSDIAPRGDDWLDCFIAEMNMTKAQVLSAIIPIKDQRGLTSTAADTDEWRPIRLTQRQTHEILPETWTAPWLLFNTGLMLVDFRDDWVYSVRFHMRDRIVRDENGKWTAMVEPEDWHFSRQCRGLGVRCYVTRKVVVNHWGVGVWSSDQVWGDTIDGQNASLVAEQLNSGALLEDLVRA